MLTRLLTLAWALCGLGLATASAQAVLADFEDGTLPGQFEARQGELTVDSVRNPNRVNMSTFAGRYKKDSLSGFSQLRYTPDAAFDLGGSLQIAFDVNANQATAVIAKLVGDPDNPDIETRFNIPVANQWRRYVTDFGTAVDGTNYTALLFFFDPGSTGEEANGVYFIDNLATEETECADVERDMLIVDDFACQRTPIRAGFDSLFVVENPDPDDVNGEGLVGEFRDPPGGFSALVYDVEERDAFDITATPIVKLKYWAPIENRLLVKLEGPVGGGGAFEVDAQVTATEEWMEYSFDMSDAPADAYTRLVIFTNAGTDAPGVVYYFDDIRFEEAPPVDFLVDFEGPADERALFFQALGGNNSAQNGSFAAIANPDQNDDNSSASVGAYTTGTAAQSTLQALSAEPFDLSVNSQLNMLLWAPAGSTTVRASAISASGRQDVTRDIPATERWIEVSFNFSELTEDTEVSELQFIFDGGTAEAGRVYYVDNFIFGEGTVDPCDGVEPVRNLIDDFECQRNATLINAVANIAIIDNPDTEGNPSTTVAEYTRPAGAGNEFANVAYTFEAPLVLDVFDRVQFDLWAPSEVPIVIKLENSANGTAAVESAPIVVSETNSWQTYTAAFEGAGAGQYQQITIFINFNTAPDAEEIYYLDNVRLARGPVSGCVFDFETFNTTPSSVNPFAGGPTVNDTAYAVIPNPDMSGINTSSTVGRFTEAPDGQPFAGMAFAFGAPASFPDDQVIRLKVWAPEAVTFVAKLERPGGEAGPGTGDLLAEYTTPNAWQELEYDVSSFDWAASGWQTFTLIPNFIPGSGDASVPAERTDYYFDELKFGQGDCQQVSDVRGSRAAIEQLVAYPNPATDQVTVTLPEGTARLQVFDALGRAVLTQASAGVQFGGATVTYDVSSLGSGLHTVVARDDRGAVLGQVRLSVVE